MDDELTLILTEFDSREKPFNALELSGRLVGLSTRLRDGGLAISVALTAEVFAWSVLPEYNCTGSGWSTYYGPMFDWGNGYTQPSIAEIDSDTIGYWTCRALQAKNPLLKLRYADVTWDFSEKLSCRQARGQVFTILIESVLALACQNSFPDEIEGYRNFKRALGIAVRDSEQLRTLQYGLIDYEDRHAVDHLLGTWGMSFDWLLCGNRKVKVIPERVTKIIANLEGRLTRLSDQEDVSQLDPHQIEGAALRLAKYYQSVSRRDDLLRVMRVYTDAFLRKAETNTSVGAAWLKRVHCKLIEFQLHDEAKAIQPTLRAASVKMREQMSQHTYSVPIGRDDFNAFIHAMLQGGWNEIFHRLIDRFLPIRASELAQLRAKMKNRFILDLFPVTIVDDAGRVIARIGTMNTDPEGNLLHHFANLIKWDECFLRCTMEALITTRGLSVKQILDQIYDSPMPDPLRRPIVERAIEAYFAEDWVVAIHILVPQIEDTVRRLVHLSGGVTWRDGKHDGMHVRNLDELLNDSISLNVLGEDVVFYLRSLLTDQRGMNVRNDVAHGLVPPEKSGACTADRLVHAMLIFGTLRQKNEAGTEATPAVEHDSDSIANLPA